MVYNICLELNLFVIQTLIVEEGTPPDFENATKFLK